MTHKFTHSEDGNLITIEFGNQLLIFVDGCGYYTRNPATNTEKTKTVEIDDGDTIGQILEKCKKTMHEKTLENEF